MTGQRLTIVSWNIGKAVGLDWRRDPARVLRVLTAMAPDIVLLQEADKRLAPRPPALPLPLVEAAGFTALDADPATPSIGHHGNAILLRAGIAATRILPLDLPGLEPRGALLARIEGPFGALTVGGLHLGLRRADRRRQITRAVVAARELGDPAILGGDLNEWRRQDAFPLPDGWTLRTPGPSFHATRPMLSLDRFLITPWIEAGSVGVLPRREAARASDHLPVWMRFGLPRG